MDKKKVLFLVPSLGMGGMERVLVNYANLFVKRGYDVTVLNFTYDDEAIVSHFHNEVHYEKNYMPVKNLWHSSLKNIIKGNFRILPWTLWLKLHSSEYLHNKYIKDDYDVEIAFFGSETIKIISGLKKKGVKAYGWVHNVNVEADVPPLGTYSAAKKVYEEIQNLICVSAKSKEKIYEVFKREEKVYVVNNPNDTKRIRQMAGAGLGTRTKDKFTFVTVARLDDKQKGFLRLFDVVKRLSEEFEFDLWVIGDGIDEGKIKQRTLEMRLNNVHFLGKQTNPYPYIRAADIYLCASYFEGFSMVMMEAIIIGTPMLTTDVSGADEMLANGKYGMIVENSEQGLYEGMKKILSSDALLKHYQEMASMRKDYLDEERIMDDLEAILGE